MFFLQRLKKQICGRLNILKRQLAGEISFLAILQRVSQIEVGKRVKIKPYAMLNAVGGPLKMGDDCFVGFHALISCQGGNITIGNHCSFNPFCTIYGTGGLQIGNDVRIATGVAIITANHGYEDPDMKICDQELTKKGIVIEDDCWIAAHAVILDGVRIGKGSVVGAGSVVTSSVDPYSVVAGNPARLIKKRGATQTA